MFGFWGREASLALVQAVSRIQSRNFEQAGFVTVEHTDVVAVFESKKRCRFQSTSFASFNTVNPVGRQGFVLMVMTSPSSCFRREFCVIQDFTAAFTGFN